MDYAVVRAKGLEELNQKQAGKIMELEHKIKMMEKKVEDEDNVLPFTKPSGKGPEGPWLLKLKTGTVFLARPLNYQGFNLFEFTHGGRKGKAVLLVETPEQRAQFTWVDPDQFSKKFDLFDIVEEPEE